MELARYDAKRAALYGVAISTLLAGFLLAFDTQSSPLYFEWRPSNMMDPLHPIVAIVVAIFTGMGLGTLSSLIKDNWGRLRAVFRPNVGRVACGLILGLLIPVAHFSGLPVTPLFGVGIFLANFSIDPEFVAVLLATLTIGYFVACLIISGVRSRLVRVALFGQFWLATYGAVFIVYGYSKFTL